MFTHLRVASSFSLQYGTSSPEQLVAAAASHENEACALTDRDGLYGAIRHIRSCIEHKLAPIVGVELLVSFAAETHTVTVLAHGNTGGAGWAALCRIISAAHSQRWQRSRPHSQEERRPILPARHLSSFLRDINDPECTVLLSPESNVGRALERQQFSQAKQYLRTWKQLLGCALNVEIICQYTQPGLIGSLRHAARTVELARECDVEMVLTNAVRLLSPSDVVTADLLSSASQLKELDEARSATNAQAWLKPPEHMLAIMVEIGSQPGVTQAALTQLLRRTEILATQCQLNPHSDLGWRKAKLPEASVAGIIGDPVRVLSERTHAGLSLRYPSLQGAQRDELDARLNRELETISRFGFAAYFLTVADVADIIRSLGIRSQARGSGAGSLVNYALGISSVDPVEHNLLFERFLSSNRETLPDIDIDVESARRHEIYRAILSKYGSTRVTLLSMRTGYRARSAARDTGRALGIDEEDIDSIAKHIWRFSASDFRAVLNEKPELRPVADRARAHERVDKLIDLVARLDRLPRHLSMHPCGVILSNSNLLSTTPVQPSGIGIAMSQFDKDDIDDIGFLKLDILGVRMQSAMAHAVAEIRRVRGPEARNALPAAEHPRVVDESGLLNLDQIRLDDEKTFETIRTTNTLGMFQIESPGQRELIGKLQPTEFEDLIAEISLFRPGPMKGNMIAPFIDARQGITAPHYLHKRFVSILAPTFGVIIYHEQVIRIFSDCMGITLSQADEYRRAMGSPSHDLETTFRRATASRRDPVTQSRLFSDDDINRIWEALRGFGSFGFCKAHGAAFALPTYQTAWLKTHFAAEFFAGLLTHDPGMYPKRLLLNEAKRLGIPILPLDINASTRTYRVEPCHDQLGIRLALTDIRNITEAEINRIVSGQPFTSIEAFLEHARPSQRLFTSLTRLGALESLVSMVDEHHTREAAAADVLNKIAELSGDNVSYEKMRAEVELLGLDVSTHILDPYRDLIERLHVVSAEQLINLPNMTEVLVAGVRVATQTPRTRSGKRVVFLTLDDGTGCSDVTFFGEAQELAGPALFTSSLLLVAGKTRRTGARGISVLAENAWSLSEIAHQDKMMVHASGAGED
jgi:error-prone DNA polymerase